VVIEFEYTVAPTFTLKVFPEDFVALFIEKLWFGLRG
jgi:hypothetical protein